MHTMRGAGTLLSMKSFLTWLLLVLAPAAAHAQGYVAAEGGGIDSKQPWATELFRWMVEKGTHEGKAPRVVIIGAVPLDEPDERLEVFRRVGSAEALSLIVDDKNANDQQTF